MAFRFVGSVVEILVKKLIISGISSKPGQGNTVVSKQIRKLLEIRRLNIHEKKKEMIRFDCSRNVGGSYWPCEKSILDLKTTPSFNNSSKFN